MRKILLAMLVGVAITQVAWAADTDMIMVPSAKDVKWVTAPPSLPITVKFSLIAGDPSKAGPFTLRVKLPPNTVIAPHTHAKLESVTVLSGEIYHEAADTLDKAKGRLVKTGGFVGLPAEMVHSVWTDNSTAVLQVTGTGPFDLHYINPADDPRNDKNDPRNKK